MHEHVHDSFGQALVYVKYNDVGMDIHDTIMAILNKLTREIFQEMLDAGRREGYLDMNDTVESIIYPYKDVVTVPENNITFTDVSCNGPWGNYVLFTRESLDLLEEYDSDRDEDDKNIGYYIIKGEFINGEIILDKSIKSMSYYHHINSDDSDTDPELYTDYEDTVSETESET